MKTIIITVVIMLVVVLSFTGIVAALPFPEEPSVVHAWLPLPVACAGYACVTWAQWSAAHIQGANGMNVLTVLLEEKAYSVLARSKGISVTDEEVQLAVDAADHVLGVSDNSLLGGQGAKNEVEREMRNILLREKLIAQGVLSPFDNSALSSVRVWHFRAYWNEDSRQIEPNEPKWVKLLSF